MSVEGWKCIEMKMRESGLPEEVIEKEKIKYIYNFGIIQFDPEDKRPVEVTMSEPDEKGMCNLGFKFYGVKSEIPFKKKIFFNDELLKFISLPPEEQFKLKKLSYSPHKKDHEKIRKILRDVEIDYTNSSVQVARLLVGKEAVCQIDNE